MKKNLLLLPFLALFFLIPSPTRAEEACLSHADVPTDQSLKVVSSVNVRSIPCMEGSTIVGGLVGGNLAHIVAVNDGWYKVQLNETVSGWVWGDFLVDPNKVEATPVVQTGTTDSATTPVDPGDQACYQHEPVPTEQTLKVKEALNLRDGACAEATQILTVLYPGEIVEAVQVEDGWYNIKRQNGTAGWVWGSYLTSDLNEPIATDPQPVVSTDPVVKDTTSPAFTDIQGTLYQNYIQALSPAILKGNPDGTYKPYASINRAEFTMIMIRALLKGEENVPQERDEACFNDIPKKQWYTKPTCYAKEKNIVSGYSDGFFRPGNNINLAEAAKIIVITFGVTKKEPQADRQWYEVYIDALDGINAIPPTLTQPSELVSREEMAAMMYAVINKKSIPNATHFNYFPQPTPAPSTNVQEASQGSTSTSSTSTSSQASVNLKACVEATTAQMNMDYYGIAKDVLALINAERSERALTELKLNDVLNASAMTWAKNGEFTHVRPNGQTFDQYESSIGVSDYNDFAESLAQRTLTCGANGCNGEDVVEQAQQVHQLFMDQEGNPDGQRKDLDNLLSPQLTDFGFGFLVEGNEVLMVYQFSDGVKGDETMLCKELK